LKYNNGDKKLSNIDYSLYLVTDSGLSKDRPILEIVEEAIKGGVSVVQLREKHATTKDFYHEAVIIKEICSKYNVPLIINDRIDIALAVSAEGVHIGQSDMPLKITRKILKDNAIIGVSVNNVEEAIEAENGGADYIGLSPIFDTQTKTDTRKALGIQGIKKFKNIVSIPIVAIGGINKDNCTEIISEGADGIAVVSAIVSAENPFDAAKILKDKIEQGRRLK